jgi:hypothetical protein
VPPQTSKSDASPPPWCGDADEEIGNIHRTERRPPGRRSSFSLVIDLARRNNDEHGAGQTLQNLVVLGGNVDLFDLVDAVDIVADLNGYFV